MPSPVNIINESYCRLCFISNELVVQRKVVSVEITEIQLERRGMKVSCCCCILKCTEACLCGQMCWVLVVPLLRLIFLPCLSFSQLTSSQQPTTRIQCGLIAQPIDIGNRFAAKRRDQVKRIWILNYPVDPDHLFFPHPYQSHSISRLHSPPLCLGPSEGASCRPFSSLRLSTGQFLS